MRGSMIVKLGAALVLAIALLGAPAKAQESSGPSLTDIVEAWLKSPHADRSSHSFTHWNEDGEIPGTCAVCHSSIGAIDYMRGPMSTPGMIDHPVPLGSTVDCATCHNSAAAELTAVPFPSGVSVDTFGSSASCAVCHQGRASGTTVDAAISGLDEDAVSADLKFINVHYAPSAATIMGGVVKGGYEYAGKTYKGQFTHVPDLSTCTDCHRSHSLEVSLNRCTACHQNVEAFGDIRMSPVDFDGDGDTSVGVAKPIAALHGRLNQAIRTYASEVAGTPIVYGANSFPYFFIDSNADGVAASEEAAFPNRYQSWTPRLLKAAYNYQVIAKDKAIYTHNPHYALQLLYDSLESLSESVDVDMTGLERP